MTQRRGTTMKTKLLQLIGATALLFGSGGVALAATVSFNPNPADVKVGDMFSVDIVGIDFIELAGSEIDIGFDSAVLRIDSVEVNTTLFNFDPDGGSLIASGVWGTIFAEVDVINDDPFASGDFTIATINLTALALGSSNLTILGASAFFSSTVQLFPTLVDGTVNVSAVPIPAAVWLFGSGLLGLIGIARRKVS